MAVATVLTVPGGARSTPSPPALSPEQRGQLDEAQRRSQKVRRAAGVASFNGWSIAVFAALSAPFAPFSLAGFALTVGMAVIAYGEFAGRNGLLRFEPAAATRLGWNQLGFLGLLVGYGVWMTLSGLSAEGPFAAEMAAKPELREILGSAEAFDQTYRLVLVGFYGVVALLSLVFQGGNAWYYFSRRRHVEAYVRGTPAWVLDLQRLTQAS